MAAASSSVLTGTSVGTESSISLVSVTLDPRIEWSALALPGQSAQRDQHNSGRPPIAGLATLGARAVDATISREENRLIIRP